MTLADRTGSRRPVAPLRAARGRPPRLLAAVRRHGGLVALLAVATALRAVVVLAYSSALWFPDSDAYYAGALAGRPAVDRPFGYSAFLRVVDGVLTFRGVAVLQHVLGLVTVVVVYALLQRRGVSRWASLLAVLPLALDAYVLDIEHFVLAESLFLLLLAVALAVLLWRARPGPAAVGAAGLLVGLMTVTRTVGTFVAGVLLVYLAVRVVLRSLRWTALASFVAGAALVVLPYGVWFASAHGSFGVTGYTGHFLYGRVSNFVDCTRTAVPDRLRPLCPPGPPSHRPDGDFFVWWTVSPANAVVHGRPVFSESDLTQFSRLAIRAQPLDYARLIARDTLHYAEPGRRTGPRDVCPRWWDFAVPPTVAPLTCVPVLAPSRTPLAGSDARAVLCRPEHDCLPGRTFALRFPRPHWQPSLVSFLQGYQEVAYTPGPVLALCALAGLCAPLLRLRRTTAGLSGPPSGRRLRQGLDPVLLAALGGVLVIAPSATSSFDYRYLLPTLVVLPPAAALALAGSWRRGRLPAGARDRADDVPPIGRT